MAFLKNNVTLIEFLHIKPTIINACWKSYGSFGKAWLKFPYSTCDEKLKRRQTVKLDADGLEVPKGRYLVPQSSNSVAYSQRVYSKVELVEKKKSSVLNPEKLRQLMFDSEEERCNKNQSYTFQCNIPQVLPNAKNEADLKPLASPIKRLGPPKVEANHKPLHSSESNYSERVMRAQQENMKKIRDYNQDIKQHLDKRKVRQKMLGLMKQVEQQDDNNMELKSKPHNIFTSMSIEKQRQQQHQAPNASQATVQLPSVAKYYFRQPALFEPNSDNSDIAKNNFEYTRNSALYRLCKDIIQDR